jgi:hypothetical protein
VRQRLALVALIVFHLYSGILVKYMYPTMVLPPLLILFGPRYLAIPSPVGARGLPGWALMALASVAQAISFAIPGDVKLTLEGNYYGLYMFEANHQCVSETEIHRKDGAKTSERVESPSARRRCNPYATWFELMETCRAEDTVARIAWRFDHSINGGPFYRIVDTPDACRLSYQAFRHNAWIRLPEEGAPIMGRPVKNFYD